MVALTALLTFALTALHDGTAAIALTAALGALVLGSTVFGTWPPSGRPGAGNQGFAKLRAGVSINANGTVGNDMFGNLASSVRDSAGVYTITFAIGFGLADKALTQLAGVFAGFRASAVIVGVNAIQVSTFDAAGAAADAAFYLTVQG